MGYFQVRYDSRVVNYDRRGFIRLALVSNLTGWNSDDSLNMKVANKYDNSPPKDTKLNMKHKILLIHHVHEYDQN